MPMRRQNVWKYVRTVRKLCDAVFFFRMLYNIMYSKQYTVCIMLELVVLWERAQVIGAGYAGMAAAQRFAAHNV